jgi:hypothetical protein
MILCIYYLFFPARLSSEVPQKQANKPAKQDPYLTEPRQPEKTPKLLYFQSFFDSAKIA